MAPPASAVIRAAAFALVVLSAGAVADGPHQVSHSGFGAYEASLTPLRDGYAVAWYDTRDGHPEIYARLLDQEGRAAGPERRLTRGKSAAYEPDVAASGDTLVVGWYERGSNAHYRSVVGAWTKGERLLWTHQLSPDSRNGKNTIVRARGDEIFCAWLEDASGKDPEVRAQWFDVRGEALSAPRSIAPAGRTTWNLNAALDDRDRAWVTFDAKVSTRTDELFLARIDRKETHVVRLTADDGKASKYSDIAIRGERAAVTWFDERDGNQEVYLFVAATADLEQAGTVDMRVDAHARRVTETPGESIGAYVAWNADRLGLAWCDNTVGQHEIYFEPFDAEARPLEPPLRVTNNPTQSLIPAIRRARDGFALVWNEFTPGPAGGHDPRGRSEIVFSFVR
jgi:hypothetical protein